jgi:hypothetical protein
MSAAAKNLIALLGLATVAFAGYYLYSQQSATTLSTESGDQSLEQMLMKTQVFIERRQSLDKVVIDSTLFEDERFRSLRAFTKPVEDMPVGRPNPFAETNQNEIINSVVE